MSTFHYRIGCPVTVDRVAGHRCYVKVTIVQQSAITGAYLQHLSCCHNGIIQDRGLPNVDRPPLELLISVFTVQSIDIDALSALRFQ